MIRLLAVKDVQTIGLYIKDDRFNCCEFRDFWTEEELRDWIENVDDITLGYFVEEELVGFCLSHCNKKISKVYIENIFVAPQFRRQGIATQLLASLLDECKKAYADEIFRYIALVEKNNIPAIESLKKAGFNIGETMYWIQKNK